MKFREPVTVRTGPRSPKEKVSSSAAEAAARTHTDIDMSHSTPEQPTFGEHDESDALRSDAIAAAELDDFRDRRLYAARLGCVLHNILHNIAVTAGMTSTFFMGPLGKGPWNEWERGHVFSLLGLVWYSNMSRSDSCCPILDSNFALLLENLRRARVAEAPKARPVFFCGADLFWGADFFSGARREEVVSMATPETMTKRGFLTHLSVLEGGVRYASSVFCAVCFETQGSV